MKRLRAGMIFGSILGCLTLASCAFIPFAKIPFDVRLSDPAPFNTEPSPVQILSADFNQDGHLDLVTVHRQNNTVALLLGQGGGQFADAVSFSLLPNPVFGRVNDFDEDGLPDLLILQDEDAQLAVLHGDADNGLVPPVQIELAHEDPHTSVHDHPNTFAIGDFNGDGSKDVALGHEAPQVDLFFGQPDGSFQAQTPLTLELPLGKIVAFDVQADGFDDLFVLGDLPSIQEDGSFDGSELLWFQGGIDGLSESHSLVQMRSGRTGFIQAVDFDQNGYLDPAMGFTGNGMLSILPNLGDGTFGPIKNYLVKTAGSATFADMDQDGKLDLITSENKGEFTVGAVNVFLNAGDFRLRAPMAFKVRIGPVSVASGDLNGNGLPDIAVANFFSNDIVILFNETDVLP